MLPRTDIKPTKLLPNRCICTVMLQRLFEWRREVEKGAQVSGSRAVVNVFLFFLDCYVTSRHAKKSHNQCWTFDPAKKHRSWGSFMLTARSYAPPPDHRPIPSVSEHQKLPTITLWSTPTNAETRGSEKHSCA